MDSRQKRQDRLIRPIPPLAAAGIVLAAWLGDLATPGRVRGADYPVAPREGLPAIPPASTPPLLRAVGRFFVDPADRVVILRGVSISGGAKVPPFRTIMSPSDLDPLPKLGFNVIRLLFLWEAYEPIPGCYDEQYLSNLQAVALAAFQRGMYVVLDFHQDGFSRFSSHGSGDGFPAWAVSSRGRPSEPDNSARCFCWPLLMAIDPTTYKSFRDFYANASGARTRFLEMTARVARAFASVPGVIGYDLLNEPWGDECRELAPLYGDIAAVIHAVHPTALVFVEGQLTTNSGVQTKLPRLPIANMVYAPHYYKPLPLVMRRWYGVQGNIHRAFDRMTAVSQCWDVPLFLGEFGMSVDVANAGAYVSSLYDHLDACLASGAQWNYTPTCTDATHDGWNNENFSILDRAGTLRPNFRPRPYPRCTAGFPIRFAYRELLSPQRRAGLEFVWAHRPECGDTELFVPACLFPPGSALAVEPADVACRYDTSRQVLICRSGHSGTICLRLTSPTPGAVVP
jgi:endoglycosylceramidase